LLISLGISVFAETQQRIALAKTVLEGDKKLKRTEDGVRA